MSYYPRFVGGAEVAVKEITDRLDTNEFEFHLVTLRYDTSFPVYEKLGNVHVHRIGFARKSPNIEDLRSFPLRLNKILYQFWAPCVGLWLHKKLKFEKVWSMMAHSAGIPGNIFSRISGVPLLLTLQEGDPTNHIEKQMRVFGPFFTSVFAQAKQIQTISHFLKEWAIKMKAKVTPEVVPNGVDLDVFTFVPRKRNQKEFRLITTSRLVPKNGVDLVIQALVLLPDNVYFDIVGDGFQKEELKQKVKDFDLEKRVVFHDQKDKKEIIALLQCADVFVRPSRSEGLGNSFLEAMAVGLPIIGTEVGGIPDFLFDPRTHGDKATGLFCQGENPKSIADCVMSLMRNHVLYHQLQLNGVKCVENTYNWNTITRQLGHLLRA